MVNTPLTASLQAVRFLVSQELDESILDFKESLETVGI